MFSALATADSRSFFTEPAIRMGKGKGTPEFWAARVKPGRIMFEVDGVSEGTAREAMRLGASKLPIRTRFIQRIAD